jgi:hypothetical protein
MATKFADFMRELEEEARAEGPEAVAQLEALRDHFRLGRQLAEARLKRKLTQQQLAKLSAIEVLPSAPLSIAEAPSSTLLPSVAALPSGVACYCGGRLPLTQPATAAPASAVVTDGIIIRFRCFTRSLPDFLL